MKIVHFSDTHLGFNDLDVINDDNINQREADFYGVFSQVVEQIKELNPCQYQTIPYYIIKECDKDIMSLKLKVEGQ